MPPLATRLALALATLALSSCASDAPVRAQRPWQSLDLQVGMRSYDDLEPVEDQTTLGLEYVYVYRGDGPLTAALIPSLKKPGDTGSGQAAGSKT